MDSEVHKLTKRKTKYSLEKNWSQLGEACKRLGELYNEQGEYKLAINEFKLLAQANQKLNRPMEFGRANRMICEMFINAEDYTRALPYAQVYRKTAVEQKDKIEQQRAHASIGRIFLLKGQNAEEGGGSSEAKQHLAEAEQSFQKSLALCNVLTGVGKIELVDMQARLYLNLGLTKEYQGELDRAIEHIEQAIRMAKDNDLYSLLHQCYVAMGALLLKVDGPETCTGRPLRILNQALEVASRLEDKATKMCETLLLKADILQRNGDFQSARQELKRAYRLRTPVASDAEIIEHRLRILVAMCKTEDELIATDPADWLRKKRLYENMGDAACKLENYSKAIDYYRKMLSSAEAHGDSGRQLIPCYVSLYQTFKDNRQYENALEYLDKEYELIKDDPREAYNTLMGKAEVCELQGKWFLEIVDMYQAARVEATKAKSIRFQQVALWKQLRVLRVNNMDQKVEELEKEAKAMGLDLKRSVSDDDDDEKSENGAAYEENTPDVGDEIDLEVDLSDDSQNEDDDKHKLANRSLKGKESAGMATRKRGSTYTVKRNNKGETQLHQAAIAGNLPLLQRLLEQGHPVNVRDHAGWLPLHEACIHGHLEVVTVLLDYGASINDKGGTSCDGITPLYDACSNGNLEVVELLLNRSANSTLRTDFGDTSLNVLENWHEQAGASLSSEAESLFLQIRDRLRTNFDNAGISPKRSAGNDTNEASGSSLSGTKRPSRSQRLTGRSSGYGSAPTERTTSPLPVRLNRQRSNRWQDDSDSDCNADNGVQQYRTAISSLRNRNTGPSQHGPSSGSKRTAYLAGEEVELDDWLINDVEQPSKKRQRVKRDLLGCLDKGPRHQLPISDETITSTGIGLELVRLPDDSHTDESLPASPISVASNAQYNEDEENDGTAFNVLMNNSAKAFRRQSGQRSRKSSCSQGSTAMRRHTSGFPARSQSSLMDAGFHLSPTKRSTSPMVVLSSPARGSPKRRPELPVIEILLEAESFTIRYDEARVLEQSVGWLREEISRRYGAIHGKRPNMNLIRHDGSLCEDTDPLTSVLDKKEATVRVDILGMLPFDAHQFYTDYCTDRKIEMNENLMRQLVLTENTKTVSVKRDLFRQQTPQWDIFFTALGFQQNQLHELNLSTNCLTDQDVQKLVKHIAVHSSLKILKLCRNAITDKGVEHLCGLLIDESRTALPELTELDLSHNLLQNQAVPHLSRLCTHMKQLQVLRIKSTAITNIVDSSAPLPIGTLRVFDVSENQLNDRSVEFLFQNMNPTNLAELNLESLGSWNVNCKQKCLTFLTSHDFDVLRVICFRNCALTDSDLESILPSLRSRCPNLQKLDLSFNPALTKIAFLNLFRHLHCRSLESVDFEQVPLLLEGIEMDADKLKDISDPSKSYPDQIRAMVPLEYTAERVSDLIALLKSFWSGLCSSHSKVTVEDGLIAMST